jgi:hypothetical protein
MDKILKASKEQRERQECDICREFLKAQGYSADEMDAKGMARLRKHMTYALRNFYIADYD